MNYVVINLLHKPVFHEVVGGRAHSWRIRAALWMKRLSVVLFGSTAVLAGMTFGPQIYGYVDQKMNTEWVHILSRPGKSFGENLVETGDKIPQKIYQPPFDPTLPYENRLVIESIGYDALIGEEVADNIEETLKMGAWRVPEFGTPYARSYPMILAAHRYGYIDWTNDYRRKHSFYNLPKLEEGDVIHVIWNQRRYAYEVIGGDVGEEITNYQADLILYTCKFLDSKERVFKYAKLIEV